ncbi:MAG TPA: SPOR domain-containing protein [Terracidiphilus sp.]|nr:SPOR domain-containing protein [Terracidiphilus sp.]
MQRGFGGTTFEPVEEGRDREITVGPTILTGFVLVLGALCAGCFVAGYAIGHRSPAESVAARPEASGPSAAQLLRDNQSKPDASQSSVAPATDTGAPAATDAGSPPAAASAEPATYQPSAPAAAPAVVQTASPAQTAAQPVSAVGQTVQPALPQAGQWMVQIAAVSHEEDADVLLSALRKRGYTVSARHDPADNLLHVQVGPFNNHNDAVTMRQKLLSDGYNAVIQP